jgi:hypothetical protein
MSVDESNQKNGVLGESWSLAFNRKFLTYAKFTMELGD